MPPLSLRIIRKQMVTIWHNSRPMIDKNCVSNVCENLTAKKKKVMQYTFSVGSDILEG